MGAMLTTRFWSSVFKRNRWRIVECVEEADLVPERLPRNGAVLVGHLGLAKWLVFDCPCRRGHRVMLNLVHTRRPFWRVIDKLSLTVTPSVDVEVDGARCHYLIRGGTVVWVRDYEELRYD